MRFVLLFILTFINLTSAAHADELPGWTDLQSGWKAEAVTHERIQFTYKTGRAFMFVEQAVLDAEKADLAKFLKLDYKKEALADRVDLSGIFATSTQAPEYLFSENSDTLTVTITNQFDIPDANVLVVEKFWYHDSVVWHAVFIERSRTLVPANSYVNAIDLLESKIFSNVKSAARNSRKRNIAWEIIFASQPAFAQEVRRARSAPAASASSSTLPIAEACKGRYADGFVRRGTPTWDVRWSDLGPACKASFKKFLVQSQKSFASLMEAPDAKMKDYPKCTALRPRPPFKTTNDFWKARNAWMQCSRNEQLKEFGSNVAGAASRAANWVAGAAGRVGRAAADPNTYSQAFRSYTNVLAVGYDLALGRPVPGVSAQAANDLIVSAVGHSLSFLDDKKMDIMCLNKQAQAEAACNFAEAGATALAATACTVATRGKCVATLKGKLKDLSGAVVAKYKIPVPRLAAAPLINPAERYAGEQFAKRFLASGRLDAKAANNLTPGQRAAAGEYLFNRGKKVSPEIAKKQNDLVLQMHAVCPKDGFGNWSPGCIAGKKRLCLEAVRAGYANREGCQFNLDAGTAGGEKQWMPYGVAMSNDAENSLRRQAAEQYSLSSWETRVPGFSRLPATEQQSAARRWLAAERKDPMEQVYAMQHMDGVHRRTLDDTVKASLERVSTTERRLDNPAVSSQIQRSLTNGLGSAGREVMRDEFQRDPQGTLRFLENIANSATNSAQAANIKSAVQSIRPFGNSPEEIEIKRRLDQITARMMSINRH